MLPRLPVLWVLLLASALCVSACGREHARPLRIGLNPWPGYESLHLAQELDLFPGGRDSVQIVELYSLADVRRAYERGDLDGFCGTLVELAEARENSVRRPRVVAVPDFSEGADVILGRAESVSDLRGRRVAVEPDALPMFVLARALDRAGLAFDDVELVHMEALRMVRAMDEREVEAVVTYPPTSLQIAKQEGVEELFTTAEIPGEVLDVIVVDADAIEKRPDDVRNLLAGWARAVAHARAEPTEAYAIMAEREGITPAEFADAFENGMRILDPDDQSAFLSEGGSLVDTLASVIDVMRSIGELEGTFDPKELVAAKFHSEFARPQ